MLSWALFHSLCGWLMCSRFQQSPSPCVCLILILNFLLSKTLLVAVHNIIHLNLAIALLLGYLLFLAGIETATVYDVCTISVDLLAPKETNYVHFSLTRQRVVWSQHSSSISSWLPSAGCCVRGSTSISYLLWSSVLFQRNGGFFYSLVGVSCDRCFPQ